MSSHLPPELFQDIINNLRDDKITLRTCSLASRLLAIESQKRIFCTVILRNPKQSSPNHRPGYRFYQHGGSADAFSNLLDNSPHIASLVQSLQIFDFRYDTGEWISKSNKLTGIISRLLDLRSFVMEYDPGEDGVPHSDDFMESILRLLRQPSLIHVALEGVALDFVLRGAGTQLRHLSLGDQGSWRTIENVNLANLWWWSRSRVKEKTYLETLKFDRYFPLEEVIGLFSQEECVLDVSRLKKLIVVIDTFDGPEQQRELWSILELCATSLEEFDFTPGIEDLDFDDNDPFDFARLQCLRRFRVNIELLSDDEENILIWLEQCLRNCSKVHPLFEQLTIMMYCDCDVSAIPFERLAPLVDVLLGGNFPSFNLLEIWVYAESREDRLGIVDAFRRTRYLRPLRRQPGIQVEVNVTPSRQTTGTLAPNPRWESFTNTGTFLEGL